MERILLLLCVAPGVAFAPVWPARLTRDVRVRAEGESDPSARFAERLRDVQLAKSNGEDVGQGGGSLFADMMSRAEQSVGAGHAPPPSSTAPASDESMTDDERRKAMQANNLQAQSDKMDKKE